MDLFTAAIAVGLAAIGGLMVGYAVGEKDTTWEIRSAFDRGRRSATSELEPIVTFTPEAIRDFDATSLGELLKRRVLTDGVRAIRVEEIDSVANRLGVRLVVDEETSGAD